MKSGSNDNESHVPIWAPCPGPVSANNGGLGEGMTVQIESSRTAFVRLALAGVRLRWDSCVLIRSRLLPFVLSRVRAAVRA